MREQINRKLGEERVTRLTPTVELIAAVQAVRDVIALEGRSDTRAIVATELVSHAMHWIPWI